MHCRNLAKCDVAGDLVVDSIASSDFRPCRGEVVRPVDEQELDVVHHRETTIATIAVEADHGGKQGRGRAPKT